MRYAPAILLYYVGNTNVHGRNINMYARSISKEARNMGAVSTNTISKGGFRLNSPYSSLTH
jgi:hypothetical protein